MMEIVIEVAKSCHQGAPEILHAINVTLFFGPSRLVLKRAEPLCGFA